LVKFGSENCTGDENRNTPLIYAADSGHVAVVRVLLEGGANAERANANQQTDLHYAAWSEHLAVCRLLLDWGAKVDPLDTWKDTPLHEAARMGQLCVIKLLVERGADVRVKNKEGRTASDIARINGKLDVAEWLNSVSRG
jgi:ankyrin repeat protein